MVSFRVIDKMALKVIGCGATSDCLVCFFFDMMLARQWSPEALDIFALRDLTVRGEVA